MEPSRAAAGFTVHSLLTLLAEGGGRTAALSFLHQRALQVAGATVSLLYEPHPANGRMQATSGAGVEALPTAAWEPSSGESAVLGRIFSGRHPVAMAGLAAELSSLHEQVGTAAAILVPLLAETHRVGLLVVGLPPDARPDVEAVAGSDVPSGFLVALELSRLRQREEFEADVRALLDTFSERLATTLDLAQALQPLCHAVTRLFACDRTTVWVHERESRHLVPLASSDPAQLDDHQSVRADDPVAPAAVALRAQRAGLSTSDGEATSRLCIPLRGCRRALGTVVCDGVRIEPGDDIALLNRADELGRQLSGAVETIALLRAVARTRQELAEISQLPPSPAGGPT
ncbi:MAG: hypothetical protein AB7H96_04125 [Vicinamibacterales bacterium]